MLDWGKMHDDLEAMREYFAECARNASPTSEARKRFTDYLSTLDCLIEVAADVLAEEDNDDDA